MRTIQDLENIFSYHKPHGDQPERYERIRAYAKGLATEIFHLCPESPERTLALRKVQEACMFANASIAINEAHRAPQVSAPEPAAESR
jgi:hypothetical protein